VSFGRVLRVVLGVIGLAESRSLRGAYYNTRQISRALKTPPKTQRQYRPKVKPVAEPKPDDDPYSMATWLTANAMHHAQPQGTRLCQEYNLFFEKWQAAITKTGAMVALYSLQVRSDRNEDINAGFFLSGLFARIDALLLPIRFERSSADCSTRTELHLYSHSRLGWRWPGVV